MKEKFIRFMQGRYGIDQLSKFLLIAGLVIVLISAFLGNNPIALILYLIGWGLVIYCYYRVFSRNVSKRYSENQAFLAKEPGISGENLRNQKFLSETEKYMAAEKGVSYLHMSVMQTEDTYTERQGENRGEMPQMRHHIH